MRKSIALILFSLLWQPYAAVSVQQEISAAPELRLGIFPRRNADVTQAMFKPFAEALSRALNRKVVIETTYDFASFWENIANNSYDLVHYNQYHYIKSHHDYGYRVIARNVEFGHEKIAGSILVRKDSNIETLQDLKGKKIIFGGGRKAMMAYIVPTYLLRQAGLNKGDYFEQFALTPPKAAIAAYYRQAAAAGSGHYTLDLPIVKKEIDTSQMKYLATSQKMAHLPWAVNKSMSGELASKIRTIMVGLKHIDKGEDVLKSMRVTKFLPADDSDFVLHREIAKTVLGEEL